jgi:tripartite-type tricarboxylate transporter receptor subunit TctC
VRERLEPLGAALVGSTPEELARHIKSEMDKWGPVIRPWSLITLSFSRQNL